jgi:monoamine oxidase
VLDKLILRFDEVFWNKECDWFNFISENPYEWT